MTDPDHELLERWRQGDAEAGNALFRRHFRSVRRFFRNKVPAGEVEDLIQRTFAGCVEARERLHGDSGFRPFLFGVARRQLYKFLRDRASYQRRVDVDLGVSSVHDLGHSPSSAMARHEHHQLLLQALQRVSVEHQTMLELFYWEQLPGPEIAEVLGIAPATVRTRLYRGRQAVEKALRELTAGTATHPGGGSDNGSGGGSDNGSGGGSDNGSGGGSDNGPGTGPGNGPGNGSGTGPDGGPSDMEAALRSAGAGH